VAAAEEGRASGEAEKGRVGVRGATEPEAAATSFGPPCTLTTISCRGVNEAEVEDEVTLVDDDDDEVDDDDEGVGKTRSSSAGATSRCMERKSTVRLERKRAAIAGEETAVLLSVLELAPESESASD
jgi:hypothetical protein